MGGLMEGVGARKFHGSCVTVVCMIATSQVSRTVYHATLKRDFPAPYYGFEDRTKRS